MINIKGVNYIEYYVYTEVINIYDEALGERGSRIEDLEKTISEQVLRIKDLEYQLKGWTETRI